LAPSNGANSTPTTAELPEQGEYPAAAVPLEAGLLREVASFNVPP